MKKILFIAMIISSHVLFAASGGRQGINSSSWSLLYGYTQNVNDQNQKLSGQAFKLQAGNRWDNNLEANFFLRYASQSEGINFSNIDGNISRKDLGGGLNFGYWLFSALNLHVGYAFHSTSNNVSGAYSSSQLTTIKSDHNIQDTSPKGLLAGVDLVLLQNKSFQLFTNYEYYHLNHVEAHDWEAMVGIRFYPGPSKSSGSSGSFFNKIFGWIFKDSK